MTDVGGLSSLEQFTLLANNTKGKGCAALIEQVLSSKKIFVVGELLEKENVSALEGTELQPYLDALRLYAYGTYGDYKANPSIYPELSASQLNKLKQLSVITLSNTNKIIPYKVLMHELDLYSVRELEDLIIESIYSGIIKASLDHKMEQVEVKFAIGRDVRPDDIDAMMLKLTQWCTCVENLHKDLGEKIRFSKESQSLERDRRLDLQQKIDASRRRIKYQNETDNNHSFTDGGEYLGEDGVFRRRVKRRMPGTSKGRS